MTSQIVYDWCRLFREAVTAVFQENREGGGKIGGPGTAVQIDKARFGRRNYHSGRVIEGHSVLGMIQDRSEELRSSPGNFGSSKSLTQMIERHVAKGDNG